MRCPTLADLPPAPPGKTGWPWTEESPQLPYTMPDGRRWPCISIVTPSYNQGEFLEETIRSVLLQGYPEIEYIIIDGASLDGSINIIRKYELWLKYWESTSDDGQPHAINKAFKKTSGEIFQWINSDDSLCIGALAAVGRQWKREYLVAGSVDNFTAEGVVERIANRNINAANLISRMSTVGYHQPGVFIPAEVLRRTSKDSIVRQDLHYIFDWYLMVVCLALNGGRIEYIDAALARFRLHERSKTMSEGNRFDEERDRVLVLLASDPIRRNLARDIQQELETIRSRDEVNQVIHMTTNRFRRAYRLAILPLRYPRLLKDRFYFGAIKHKLLLS